MIVFDPRTIATSVYDELNTLRKPYEHEWKKTQLEQDKKIYYDHLREQKSQAVELYTYVSTWGLMRLKAEEMALDKTKLGEQPPKNIQEKAKKSQEGKREVIAKYFLCLEKLADTEAAKGISEKEGLIILKKLDPDEYLGLMGLGLALSQEFAFWANAIYHDIKGEE